MAFDGSRDESRLPLPFHWLLVLSFLLLAPLPGTPGVESASIAPLVSDFGCNFLAHSILSRANRRSILSVQTCNGYSAVVLSHYFEFNNVRLKPLRVADLRVQGVPEDHFRDCNSQARGDEFPTCVKPL